MHWIIDYKDRFVEEEYHRLIQIVDHAGLDYTLVSLTNNVLDEDVIVKEKAIAIGTIPLMKIAQDKGWLIFLNGNFKHQIWAEHYGVHLLNHDAILCPLKEVPYTKYDEFFIRPAQDGKLFTGLTLASYQFEEWRTKKLERPNDFGFGALNEETIVIVSSKKDLLREYRFFVIKGKVITGSLYRQGKYIKRELCIEQDVIDFAQSMVDLWQPHESFVIDIGMTADGFKIVEINCLNTSGFYCSDTFKIVEAIESNY